MNKVKVAKKVIEKTHSMKLSSDKDTVSELDSKIDGLIRWIKSKNNLP
jgi:hypothetical protein